MPSVSRRDALTSIGTGLITVLAGCLSNSCKTQIPETGDWLQIGHDAQHTGSDISLTGVTEGANHWQITHESVFNPAGFAVRDDQLVICGRYQPENGFLRLRSLADGELWQTVEVPTPVIAPPVLSENVIIVTCRIDNNHGCYHVYDYDGEHLWTHELTDSLPASPTISQSTVYGGGSSGTVFALRESDGEVLWERSFGDEREGGSVSVPVTVDDTNVYVPIYSSTEQGIYALSRKDGSVRWKIKGPQIQSTMVRTGDVLLVSYPSYDLVAFEIQSGERRWSHPLVERRISPPAVGSETVVISDEATLYGLDLTTGDQRWTVPCNPSPNTQPVIAGNTVIVPSDSGLIGCSLSGGERLWTIDSGSGVPVVPIENGLVYSPELDTIATYMSCQN